MKRKSKCYSGTFSTTNVEDLKAIGSLKHLVKEMNAFEKVTGSPNRYRLVLRGRKPFVKHAYRNRHNVNLSIRSYDWCGNIVGGIKNAQFVDAYIYKRK